MIVKQILPVCSLLLICTMLFGQPRKSRVLNASFEGEPRDASVPRGWYICKEGTTPEILPGPWGVYLEPADGDTYVGLITRENGTWESIGQRLTEPLFPGECYVVSMFLARSETYMGFNNPIKMRIWGGAKKCERGQLLVETKRVENTEWIQHHFQFTPEMEIKYIIIEAFHQEGFFSYRGNVLIDGLSAVRRCGRS